MALIEKIQNLPLPALNHWGYWIILLAAVAEATPIFGLLIPGQSIVMAAGFFVRIGKLELGDVIFASAMGAILGDFIGYMLGRKYGYSLITRYGKYFFFKKTYFEKTKKLMGEHTGKALIIGRFNSLTRAFAPFVAGSSNVPFIKFFVYNFIGGISWAVAFVIIGYIFGASYEIASKYIGRFVIIAVVVSILFIYLYRYINKRKHIFARYHLLALVINIVSLYLFSKMAEDVIDKEMVTRLDLWINSKMVSLWNPFFNKITTVLSNITTPFSLFILSVILLAFLMYRRKWYYSLLLFFSMSGGLVFMFLMKLIIHRARPENALIEIPGFSFPSGHAVIATIFFSLLLYALKEDIRNRTLRHTFIIANIILFILVGFSRVYLNIHWFSDVIAGISLGLFWLTLLILIFKIITGSAGRASASYAKIKSNIKKYITLAKKLQEDKRVPRVSKLLLGSAVGDFFLPIDRIPDFMPLIGHLNDIIMIPSFLNLAIILIPKEVVHENCETAFKNKHERYHVLHG